jgi:hypothetical protein
MKQDLALRAVVEEGPAVVVEVRGGAEVEVGAASSRRRDLAFSMIVDLVGAVSGRSAKSFRFRGTRAHRLPFLFGKEW